MEIFQFVVAVAAGIGAICAAVKAIAALIRWLRTWKIIKLQELKRLKAIEAEHQKCEAEKERLRKLDNPIAREIRDQLDRMNEPKPIRVNTEFNAREPFKNWK
jgi:hypothetical protein